MASVKLGLSDLNLIEKRQLAAVIAGRMAGNPNFPAPVPPLTALDTLITSVDSLVNLIETTRSQLNEQFASRDELETALDATLVQLASYVQSASGGDPIKIESSGMSVRQPPTPIGPMPQVLDVRAEAGPGDLAVSLRWKPVPGRFSYEISAATGNPDSPSAYVFQESVTKARTTLENLTGCTRYWFRVRAIGPLGPGPWSDPATAVAA